MINNDSITKRKIDFAKWYTDVIREAELFDYGGECGSAKGTILFRPHGYRIWELISEYLKKDFFKINIVNVALPLLISEKAFNLEKDHIKGFAPECAIVTQVGNKKLSENYIIRPTSEVLFGKHFHRIVKSYKQLPLLYNQWCSVIRWEKTTRPFLRNSEFLWQEGHTVHSSAEDALTFTIKIINLYATFVEKQLAIKVIIGKKTEHERFAGALETYTIESMMQDGQALQAGTSHYFGQKFAQVFDIKFNNKENQQEYAYQTSWGVSTRLIGALIMAHSDDSGLILPSTVAPIQIAILNLLPKNAATTKLVLAIEKLLQPHFSLFVNDQAKSFSDKKKEAQIKGIPIILEVGAKESSSNEIKVTLRSNNEIHYLKFETNNNFVSGIKTLLMKLDQDLLLKSQTNFDNNLKEITNFSDYQTQLKTHKGYFIAPFCGIYACEAMIKAETATTSRCVPLVAYKTATKCFKCQKENSAWTYFARSY